MTFTPDSSTPAARAAPRAVVRIINPLSPWLLWPVATLVVVVIGFSFILSFQAQMELAVRANIPAEVAWGWPIIVDGTVVIATVSALILQPRGVSVSWYPWAVLILFGSLSIFVNALHALDAEPEQWVLTIISATPAVSLLLATHLLTTLVGHGGSKAPGHATAAVADSHAVTSSVAGTTPAATPHAARATPAAVLPRRQVPETAALQAGRDSEGGSEDGKSGVPEIAADVPPAATARRAPKPLARASATMTREAVAERVHAAQPSGTPVTGDQVATWMNVSATRGQKILDQILTETEAAA